MKLIIDIPDEQYNDIVKHLTDNDGNYAYSDFNLREIIRNGTPYDPSGDLIIREALKEALKSNCKPELCHDYNTAWCESCCPHNDFEDLIDNAPTVDIKDQIAGAYNEGYMCGSKEAEKARPQGEWIPKRLWDNTHIWVCSECGNQNKHGITVEKACWKCGAKMKGGAE